MDDEQTGSQLLLPGDYAHRGARFRRFSRTTPIPSAAGIPTNRPPKMHTNRNGDCALFAPDRMATAAKTAKPMKKKPTLAGTGFLVTLMARSILCPSRQLTKPGDFTFYPEENIFPDGRKVEINSTGTLVQTLKANFVFRSCRHARRTRERGWTSLRRARLDHRLMYLAN